MPLRCYLVAVIGHAKRTAMAAENAATGDDFLVA